MTTETKSDEKTTPETKAEENKRIFGPLGKYAVIAVIMVSVIVTTAVMLDRQLSTVEQHIAAIEDEVTEMNTVVATASESADKPVESFEMDSETLATSNTEHAATEPADAKQATAANNEKAIETQVTVAETQQAAAQQATPATDAVAQGQALPETNETHAATVAVEVSQAAGINNVAVRQERLARIEEMKAEQKQRISDMFARIEALEAKQLVAYKSHQDQQIERLRQQIAQQQLVIEALISRNKEMYDLRAANVQRKQETRDAMLNRI